MMFSRSLLTFVCAAVLPCTPAVAQAGAKPAKPALKFMSRQELRSCVLFNEDLTQRQEALSAAQKAHNDELARLGQESLVLAELLRTLDTTVEAAVDAFNQRNDARNVEVEAVNKRGAALVAMSIELNAGGAEYFERCASKPFLLADRDAVLKELGRVPKGEKPSSPVRLPTRGQKSTDI